ncbi:MAG: DUF2508 family protein [Sporomusaceae bacterium]|nr:DUF2508 family protein [Sporomusaceae bacterium]
MKAWWERILVFLELKQPRKNPLLDEVRLLAGAKEEWLRAKRYFEFVHDPDLTEYAIFSIKAAEIKYRYLLKQARLEGLCVLPISQTAVLRDFAEKISPPWKY